MRDNRGFLLSKGGLGIVATAPDVRHHAVFDQSRPPVHKGDIGRVGEVHFRGSSLASVFIVAKILARVVRELLDEPRVNRNGDAVTQGCAARVFDRQLPCGSLEIGKNTYRTIMTDVPKNLNPQLQKLGLTSLFASPPKL